MTLYLIRYPYLASEIFACELTGIIDNFFNDAEIDLFEMTRLKSVDFSTNQSPLLKPAPNGMDEQDLITALNEKMNIDCNENQKNEVKKITMGEYLFENLHNYFKNSTSFINPTSAVYFQKVLYALLNKKGYETVKIIFEKKEIVKDIIKHLDMKPLAEVLIRFLLLDSCYSYMNTPIFLNERKEIIEQLFEQFHSNKDPDVLENTAYIFVEIINRNTSGNSCREIIGFILNTKHMDEIFSKFDESLEEYSSEKMLNYLQVLQSLINFCVLEETRNNYKSPFVNCDLENECDGLCTVFLDRLNEKLPEFLEFLKTSNCNKSTNTSWKENILIFGLEKLRLLELLSSLLKFKSDKLLATMLQNDVYSIFFNLFQSHPFHSILHNTIFQFIRQSFHKDHEKINAFFFEKAELLNFIIKLSKDELLRVNSSQKKIAKGYNGYIILFIEMIYNYPNLTLVLEQLLDANTTWKDFLLEYYKPHIQKISLELGGYHPRTKKENYATSAEEDEMIFFYDQKPKTNIASEQPQSFKFNGWSNNQGTVVNGFNGCSAYMNGMNGTNGDYDYYFEENNLNANTNENANRNSHQNGLQKETPKEVNSNELNEKIVMPELQLDKMEEEGLNEALDDIRNNVNKCRYEYEEDYFFN